jgi:acetyltransferase-like isoleucine patch superfamily enzyme
MNKSLSIFVILCMILSVVAIPAALATDTDQDGISDALDNCPFVANADQMNNDGDVNGDECDVDDDNDAVTDLNDNCQFVPNANQQDTDSDGLGDACDPLTNGQACNDGNVCTQTDVIVNGVCVGMDPVACYANDACHVAGICDPQTGECSNPAAQDYTPCDDGDACTPQDVCQNGVCAPTSFANCNDNDDCTADGCDPAVGCFHSPLSGCGASNCDDHNACTDDSVFLGACTYSTHSCDDGNAFTSDSCDSATGCVFALQDIDGDGIADNVDNCPNVANADQMSTYGDGIGDACDSRCVFYPDNDHDGYGATAGFIACIPPAGSSRNNQDCNDGNSAIAPGAAELCDGLDNNCDGAVDENGICNSVCGNGVVDSGEQCDGGACCTESCTLAPAGMSCGPRNGPCDLEEFCTGASASCPADSLVAAGTECRAAVGPCDVAEYCLGFNAACPANSLQIDETPCSGGSCFLGACVASDIDGDGITDASDNCPAVANEDQMDTDGDGLGDACDTPVCGNNVVEAGEQCDAPGQCCSSTCQFVTSPCNTNLFGKCGTGMCNSGTCQQTVFPFYESCNGADDNCDGIVDDGNPGSGSACNTGLPGPCAAGVTACSNGQVECNQNIASSAETCNGVDDNCDGQVDEGVCTPPPADQDGDGVPDASDNCLTVPNPDQLDANHDGFGDACVSPTATIGKNVTLGTGVVIGDGVIIRKGGSAGSNTVIGNNVTIGRGASIGSGDVIGDGTAIRLNATVGDNVHTGVNVIIGQDTIVGDGTSIGDGSAIRQGAHVGKNVVIGKNVNIAADAVIGDNVVIGDNTDIRQGAKIGNGAHIGKNVIVRKNKIVAAGATVPDGATV